MAENYDLDSFVYFSYCPSDRVLVQEIKDYLSGWGVSTRCQDNILPGQEMDLMTKLAIENTHAFLFFFSDKSQVNSSRQFFELRCAIEVQRKRHPDKGFIIPIKLSDCSLPKMPIDSRTNVSDLKCLDFQIEGEKERALRKLRQILNIQEEPTTGNAEILMPTASVFTENMKPAKSRNTGRLIVYIISGAAISIVFGFLINIIFDTTSTLPFLAIFATVTIVRILIAINNSCPSCSKWEAKRFDEKQLMDTKQGFRTRPTTDRYKDGFGRVILEVEGKKQVQVQTRFYEYYYTCISCGHTWTSQSKEESENFDI